MLAPGCAATVAVAAAVVTCVGAEVMEGCDAVVSDERAEVGTLPAVAGDADLAIVYVYDGCVAG